jgi:hypothetical protein
MASDFSVAWQCLSKWTIVFFVTDQTPWPRWSRTISNTQIKTISFFVSPVDSRHRNKVPAPLWHWVDVFFCLFSLFWTSNICIASLLRLPCDAYYYAPIAMSKN